MVMKQTTDLIKNKDGFLVPLMAFILTIIVGGMLYTLFILWVGIPFFNAFVPEGDFKMFIQMGVYAFPLVILFGCSIWFIRVSIKRSGGYSGGY
jgi:hypothetical protein